MEKQKELGKKLKKKAKKELLIERKVVEREEKGMKKVIMDIGKDILIDLVLEKDIIIDMTAEKEDIVEKKETAGIVEIVKKGDIEGIVTKEAKLMKKETAGKDTIIIEIHRE